MTEQNKADLIARMRVMLGKEMSLPAARYLLDTVESRCCDIPSGVSLSPVLI